MSLSVVEKALDYLKQHNVMTLATNGAEGVWAAAVFYVNDGFSLYFLSAPGSRHGLNLAGNPAAAVTIQADYRAWPDIKGIQAEGEVVRLAGRAQAHAIGLYARKFPLIVDAPPAIARALGKVAWYQFAPHRLYFIDNSVGFGHRDQILPQERNL
ncbi:MAG: hypothetical protein Kow0031_17770 [Anaerolineae bacterium]